MIKKEVSREYFRINDEGSISFEFLHLKKRVQLEFQLYQILSILLRNQNKLVGREELIDQVWSENPYVGRGTLTRNIWRLRKVLKDHELSTFVRIETVPKRGYKLVFENPPKRSFSMMNRKQTALYGIATFLFLLVIFFIGYVGSSEEVDVKYAKTFVDK